MDSHQLQFEKDLRALREKLRQAGFEKAWKAIDFAQPYHLGYRKDGVTLSFHHQVEIAFSLYNEKERLAAAGLDPDEVIALGVLHDTYEDNQEMPLSHIAAATSKRLADMACVLSKVRNGVRIDNETYYNGLLEHPEAVIVKLHDRRNNLETLIELPVKKQVEYVFETRHLLEMGKQALRRYPELETLLQSLRMQQKKMLRSFLAFAEAVQDGKAAKISEALKEAGLLSSSSAPLPSSGHGPLLPQAGLKA